MARKKSQKRLRKKFWRKIKSPWVGWSSFAASWLPHLWRVERKIGLAGVPDDSRSILEMTALIPPGVGYFALGVFTLFAWARWGDNLVSAIKFVLVQLRRPSFVIGAVLAVIILPSIVTLGYLTYTDIRAARWGHPTMTAAEQRQARGWCKFDAMKATTSMPRRGERVAMQRYLYQYCLISKGFTDGFDR